LAPGTLATGDLILSPVFEKWTGSSARAAGKSGLLDPPRSRTKPTFTHGFTRIIDT